MADSKRRTFRVVLAVDVQAVGEESRSEFDLLLEVEAHTPMAAATLVERALQRLIDEGVGRG